MYFRLESSGVYFDRPARNTKYIMLKHKTRWANPLRDDLLIRNKNKYKIDGLSNCNYTLHGYVKYALLTHLLIDVGPPPLNMADVL
jgi:hypothetical protein